MCDIIIVEGDCVVDDNKRIEEFMKRVSSNGDTQNSGTQYQYSYVEMEDVINNPNEYIIPQCLPACKILWNKNIETFMVSNNEDDHLYVLLTNISEDNKNLLHHLIQQDSRYFFDHYRNTYGFKAEGIDNSAASELSTLANQLKIQDTLRFKPSEKFLSDFKMTGGKMEIDKYGHIIRQENPELSNVTLEEALRRTGKEQLYVEQENRVYESAMYLQWHQRYLKSIAHAINNQTQGEYSDDQESGRSSSSKPRI